MTKFILKRVLQIIGTMLVVSVVSFLLMEILPGDRIYQMMGEDITPEEYEIAFKALNLDKPVYVRYFYWLVDALKGDFGKSYQYGVPVWELLKKRIPISIYISILSLIISFGIGIALGLLTAVKRGTWVDSVVTFLANICACLPSFWLGMLCLYIFALKTGWLPTHGFYWIWEDARMHFLTLIMPLFCVSLSGIAGVTRQTRSCMLDVTRQDFIRTAYAKGLPQSKVIFRHVLKNGLVPIITMVGSRLAGLIGGSMFIESVFSVPGMGSLLVSSIGMRDLPVVQACVVLTALCACVAFLLTDLMYCVVDPRITLTDEG